MMGFPFKLDVDSQSHIEKTLALFSVPYHAELLTEYQVLHKQSLRDANLYFLNLQEKAKVEEAEKQALKQLDCDSRPDNSLFVVLKGSRFWMDYDTINEIAERRANMCIRMTASEGSFFCENVGIELPIAKEEKGVYLRLCSPKWWSRKLFTKLKRDRELFAIQSGKVQKVASPYCSQFAFDEIKRQDEINQELMQKIKLVSGDEEITLFEAWQSSTSNPYNRFTEMITRVKGLEAYGIEKDHTAYFLTITAPSKFHAYLKTGRANPRYKGASPRDTHAHLMAVWVKLRAQFAKQNIEIYGLRIVEPHHDATPHYHMVIFGEASHVKKANKLMLDYFTMEDKAELKDVSVRFKADYIDPEKGSAVGYVIKYLAKNITCEAVNNKAGIDHDTDKPISETVGKVVAWARTWGIRQFTFFGGASVTPWRELRRITKDFENEALEALRQSALNSNWGEYQTLMESLDVKPYAVESFDPATGEIALNQYQEPTTKIKGIQADGAVYISRFKDWKKILPKQQTESC